MIQILKISILTLFFNLAFTFGGNSQTQKLKPTQLIYIEVDPLAYINRGYSIHLGCENWGMRYDFTLVEVDFPIAYENAFYDTDAFDLRTNIIGLKVDYLGNRTNWTKGAFIGADINYQSLHFQHRETLQQETLQAYNIGIRAGYKFNIYRGLYITPWAAVWKNINTPQSFSVDEDMISTNGWDWITTFHVGYGYKF